jgi:hypothetical protein
MSTAYYCLCSRCLGSKLVVKHTIEVHFQQDQDFLDTLHPNTISAKFVQSRIDQTTKLLIRINEGHGLPDMASDPDGSYPEGSEGVLFKSSLNFLIN